MEPELIPPEGTEVFTTSNSQVWFGPDNIKRVIFFGPGRHTFKDALENLNALDSEKKPPHPILVDIRKLQGMDREARNIYRDPLRNAKTTMVALIVSSPLSRAIGNFFIGLNRMHVPTRLFSSVEEAYAWLRGGPT